MITLDTENLIGIKSPDNLSLFTDISIKNFFLLKVTSAPLENTKQAEYQTRLILHGIGEGLYTWISDWLTNRKENVI